MTNNKEEKAIPKEDMDKTLKQLHAEGKSIRLEPQEEKPQEWEEGVIRLGRKHNLTWNQAKAIFLEWVKKEDIKKWAEERIREIKADTLRDQQEDGSLYVLDNLLKYLDT